jgi:hypothetical protein
MIDARRAILFAIRVSRFSIPVLALGGCYHYRVAAPQVSNLNEPVSVTKWAYLWGLLQEADEDTSCRCMNNGIKEVTASTHLGYLLLGVVSLGTVVPTELVYVCAKPPVGGKWPDPPAAACGDVVILPPPVASSSAPLRPVPSSTPPPRTTTPNDPDAGDF